LHPEKHPKHFQKKKKAMLSVDVEERVENTSDLEGKIKLHQSAKGGGISQLQPQGGEGDD
jgi:hypothetical protein